MKLAKLSASKPLRDERGRFISTRATVQHIIAAPQPAKREIEHVIPRLHLTVGADPEFFVFDKKGQLVSAERRFKVRETNKPDQVYLDGYQAEFNPKAGTCLMVLGSSIAGCLALAKAALADGEVLSAVNTVEIPLDQIANDPPHVAEFGCTPSLNAYGGPPALLGVNPREVSVRSAGGHLHFTLPRMLKTKERRTELVKLLDAILGVLSVSIFQYWDSPLRRKYYGRAGEYRETKYGIEYRVLSNAWLTTPLAMHFVYELARRVIGSYERSLRIKGIPVLLTWNAGEEEVQAVINNCDVAGAHKIIERNKDVFDELMRSLPSNWRTGPLDTTASSKRWTRLIMDGLHTVTPSPDVIDLRAWSRRAENTMSMFDYKKQVTT